MVNRYQQLTEVERWLTGINNSQTAAQQRLGARLQCGQGPARGRHLRFCLMDPLEARGLVFHWLTLFVARGTRTVTS